MIRFGAYLFKEWGNINTVYHSDSTCTKSSSRHIHIVNDKKAVSYYYSMISIVFSTGCKWRIFINDDKPIIVYDMEKPPPLLLATLYSKMYGPYENQRFNSLSESKTHIDKFLTRLSNLTVFL